MLCLFIVMAIGRFAYTPIMPFMQLNTSMDNPSAGMLATYNYLGYLIGAMIPIWIIVFNKVVDLKIYLMINIISTLFMGIFDSYILWAIFRFVSGVSSGTFCISIKCCVRSIKNGSKRTYIRSAL